MADPVIVRLLGTGEQAVDCDECFDQLDRYVEAEQARQPVDELFAGLRAHLAACRTCAEEHESLRALLETEEMR